MKWTMIILLFTSFYLSSQNEIALLSLTDYNATSTSTKKLADFSSETFLLSNRILVKAYVNESPGWFLFDTGAPTLVLNRSCNNSEIGKSIPAGSFNQTIDVREITVNEFRWGQFRKKEFGALSIDLNHLQGMYGEPLNGLLGYEVFDNKSILISSDHTSLKLLNPKEFRVFIKKNKPLLSIPFTMIQHLPVIRLDLNGKKYFFALDTGAEKNLLDKDFKHLISSEKERELIQGLGTNIECVISGTVDGLSYKGFYFGSNQFLFPNFEHLHQQFSSQLNGVLGMPFLGGRAFAINYRTNRLYIW